MTNHYKIIKVTAIKFSELFARTSGGGNNIPHIYKMLEN
jgi:hypothetical protein